MSDQAPDDGQTQLIDPDGNVVSGPSSMVPLALESNYQLATPENLQAVQDQKTYGGALGGAEAFGMGALGGATFGAGPAVLAHAGLVSSGAQSGLAATHPYLNALGSGAGILGATLLAPEAGGLDAAESALAAAKAGGDAAEIASASRAFELAKNSLSSADLANPVGAASKLGKTVTAGLSPAGDGALSAIGQLGAKGLGSAIEGGFYGAGQTLTEDALGDPDAISERLLANVGYGGLLNGALGVLTAGGARAAKAAYGAAKSLAGGAMDALLGKAEGVAGAAPEMGAASPPGEARTVFDPFTKETREITASSVPAEGKSRFDPFTRETLPPLPEAPPAEATLPPKPGLLARASAAVTDNIPEEQQAVISGARSGETPAAQPGGKSGFGGMMTGVAMGHAAGVLGPLASPALGAYGAVKTLSGALLHPEVLATRLGNLERAAQKTTGLIERGAAAVFDSAPVAGVQAATKGSLIQTLEGHRDRIGQITQQAADPGKMMDAVQPQTQLAYEVAPKVTTAVNLAAARATQFLAAKAPQVQPTSLFGKKPEVSTADLATFNRYYQATDNPLSVLSQIKDGTLTPEATEAVKTVYPRLYYQMGEAMMSKMATLKDRTKVPRQTRLMISQFMGQPLDPSLTPQSLQMAQLVHAAPEAGKSPKPTAGGLGKLSMASRFATPFQATAERGDT